MDSLIKRQSSRRNNLFALYKLINDYDEVYQVAMLFDEKPDLSKLLKLIQSQHPCVDSKRVKRLLKGSEIVDTSSGRREPYRYATLKLRRLKFDTWL